MQNVGRSTCVKERLVDKSNVDYNTAYNMENYPVLSTHVIKQHSYNTSDGATVKIDANNFYSKGGVPFFILFIACCKDF